MELLLGPLLAALIGASIGALIGAGITHAFHLSVAQPAKRRHKEVLDQFDNLKEFVITAQEKGESIEPVIASDGRVAGFRSATASVELEPFKWLEDVAKPKDEEEK